MTDTISIYEAAKWLAEMAGADGEITPNERKILKSFAEKYGVDFSKLTRMSMPFQKLTNKRCSM